MLAPPLDTPTLLARFAASELEARIRARGEAMPAAEELWMELWRQRRSIVAFIIEHAPAQAPAAAARELDQPELFDANPQRP